MGIAKNDIERALHDLLEAGKNESPDFAYRVRLATGHLVERSKPWPPTARSRRTFAR